MTKLNIQIYTKELQKRLAGDFECGNPYINEFIKDLKDSFSMMF